MKLKTILLIAAMALTLTACGSGQAQQALDGSATAVHDATEKENTHEADLKSAKEAETGSTKTLSGKYKIEGTQNTFYVVEDDKLSLVESGTYEFGDDSEIT
ncbi:MAG: hypothetical protein IJ733_02345, partial [Lachnospiraceae bacterium]|nr:hypothetical protein [Lachnospiraceae bacterium]